MILAARFGVPVPVIRHAQGPDLVMDRVDGTTMTADLVKTPDRAQERAATLAGLHRLLDAVPAPTGRTLAAPTAEPHRLIHGDLRPDNIILSVTGPVLIDWTNTAFGPSAHDVAQTWLVLACFDHPDPAPHAPPPQIRAFAAWRQPARWPTASGGGFRRRTSGVGDFLRPIHGRRIADASRTQNQVEPSGTSRRTCVQNLTGQRPFDEWRELTPIREVVCRCPDPSDGPLRADRSHKLVAAP